MSSSGRGRNENGSCAARARRAWYRGRIGLVRLFLGEWSLRQSSGPLREIRLRGRVPEPPELAEVQRHVAEAVDQEGGVGAGPDRNGAGEIEAPAKVLRGGKKDTPGREVPAHEEGHQVLTG